jgi:hypothetical protein
LFILVLSISTFFKFSKHSVRFLSPSSSALKEAFMGGRPKKYTFVVNQLDDHELYSSAQIGRLAADLLCTDTKTKTRKVIQRVRITMARFATKHEFPHEGDGMVTLEGQAPTPGWYGWRWKDTYGDQK